MRFVNIIAIWLFTFNTWADEINVAVAANFLKPLQVLEKQFSESTGHKLVISSGATGQLAAQIKNGAPFDILLAADVERPTQLVKEGFAVADSQFVYAIGKLALWSKKADFIDAEGKVLSEGKFEHLAIANPKTAPYGAAAMQVLSNMKLADTLSSKIVQGDSITQAYQFIASGSAELGFVALSQLKEVKGIEGSYWILPNNLFNPILQGAVLINKAKDNATAKAFLAFLQTDAVKKQLIEQFGYGVP